MKKFIDLLKKKENMDFIEEDITAVGNVGSEYVKDTVLDDKILEFSSDIATQTEEEFGFTPEQSDLIYDSLITNIKFLLWYSTK